MDGIEWKLRRRQPKRRAECYVKHAMHTTLGKRKENEVTQRRVSNTK